jgi:anoctamin-10
MAPQTDLVITFRASPKARLSKQQLREDARKAEQQYKRLIETLTYGGLKAVGRRGDSLGHLLIFISCPKVNLSGLVKRERHSDFMYGLPTSRFPSEPVNLDAEPLAPADRIRLVYGFVTSTPADGGLGISPDSHEWDLVESIMALHDKEFNEAWIKAWTYRHLISVQLYKIRDQFGESVALYFAFLSAYARALIFPALLGASYYFFGSAYSPVYSILLLLWSTTFVEYWQVRERILALQFGTRGSFKVEKRRVQYLHGFSWWKRELRMVATLPVVLAFVVILSTLLTAMFVFEAFITHLYTGPGQKFVGFAPTVLFVLLVPRFVGLYQALARRFTTWENHAHQSSHDASLTLKSFVVTALIAYSGLALSAFVYVPFGEGVMRIVQVWLFDGFGFKAAQDVTDSSHSFHQQNTTNVWEMNASSARERLNPQRLRDQMFAYTVTNQIVNTFVEVGLPFVLRAVANFRNGKKDAGSSGSSVSSGGSKRKKVVFEDEKARGGQEELEFLEEVRNEVALPEYELFGDYSEMVMQFGYVALWSTIWPLAPVMALINNIFELKSDAFKITVHHRRPIPNRTDTIGPWLDALNFLTWLSALTNSALVYLFHPRYHSPSSSLFSFNSSTTSTSSATCASTSVEGLTPIEKVHKSFFEPGGNFDSAATELFLAAALIALIASHGYILVRAIIRHLVERIVWKASTEVVEREKRDKELKEGFLNGMLVINGSQKSQKDADGSDGAPAQQEVFNDTERAFWEHDEGLDEIQRIAKEA